MTLRRASLMMIGLILSLGLAGCQSSTWADKDTKPFPALASRARSQAFAAPTLSAAQAQAGLADQEMYLHWYDLRNDYLPTVTDGYLSPTYENSVTYSYDRSGAWGNRVFDYSSQSTYRVRVQQSAR